MIITDLLKQEFRKSFRSQTFYRGLAVKIFVGFMAVYFAVIFVMLGFFLGDILNEADDKLNPLEVFNGAFLYILLALLMLRFFVQSLNTINLTAYQTLPVKRSALVNFILLKPFFGIANYLSLLVVIPFAISTITVWYSVGVALRFILIAVFLIWMNILLTSYLKRRFGSSLMAAVVMLVVIAAVAALEYFKVFSLFEFSRKIFGFITLNPVGFLVPLILALLAYSLNRLFFAKNYYPEKFNEKLSKGENKVVGGFSFLEKYGTVGELIQLQLRLIFRHKRTKSLIIMSAFFMLYGLLFYTSDMYNNSTIWLIFCGLVLTGMASITYGQWAISWESNYFDAILTKNIPAETYIKANFILLISFNIISFVLSIPYVFLGVKYLYLHIAMFLLNTGINVFLLMFSASYNTKKIDLMAKSSFNYQGTTYKNFLIILPLMGLPSILAFVLGFFFELNTILLIIGIVGFVGMLLIPQQMKWSTKQFLSRKYAMAEGFREKE